MTNALSPGNDELVTVDYSDLLEQILRVLRNRQTANLFTISSDRHRLLIDIDTIAAHLATLQVQNPLSSTQGVSSATVNFSREFRETYPSKLREIRDCLKQLLESTLGQGASIDEFVASLVTPLQSFQGNSNQLGFTYNFNKSQNLQKQRLETQRGASAQQRPTSGSASLLKFHKVTIAVQNINRFHEHLRQGLENYIDNEADIDDEIDKEDIHSRLRKEIGDELSDFHRLQQIVDTETLGKLKKEAKIRYLEYLRDNIDTTDTQAVIYLQDLIRRLRLIEEYISDLGKSESDYEVNYAGARLNLRDVFSRSEALDALPIIPIISGSLGENTHKVRGETQFTFGLKLKFNGKAQAHGGQEAFDYHLDTIINPDSKEHQDALAKPYERESFAKRVLRRAFLYYFVFASRSNPAAPDYNPESELDYNPIPSFESKVLPVLQQPDDAAKQKVFQGIRTGLNQFNVRLKINRLRDLLKESLKKQTILPPRTYPIQIGVRKGILDRDINNNFNGIFFNDVLGGNPKECLRYISIGEARVDENALCQLPASITIEDIRYFPTESRQEFGMEYDIKGIDVLPLLWVPESCMSAYHQYFKQGKLVFVRFNNRRLDEQGLDSTQAFVYQFTISLLAYICLKILLGNAPSNLFISMVRLHEGTHENPAPSEKFMANLSKTLCHLLGEKHRCSSQGFRIKTLNRFKLTNGLSSLYSLLPKKFRFADASPQLDKLALIIVSSMESDARKGSRHRHNRISNLLGEVIGITRQDDRAIRLELLKTFSDNYRNRRLYAEPPILVDTVNNLYQQGYRHFLYIARAPHTSTLHITQTNEVDEELYFMSPTLIKALKGDANDIKIYPVFFDKYYVRKSKELNTTSLYIQNTEELLSLAEDPSQQAVVFFNLFNGIQVGQGDDRFYNGVVSYSTLVGNFYTGILDDQDIRQGLIYDDSSLKNDILQYLTLFHFSRFEKDTNISLKLDPYDNLIGDDSVGKLSLFNHMIGEVSFNSLAFLTEVQKILNLQQ